MDGGGEQRLFLALLVLSGLGVGAWVLLRNTAGQAQAPASLPGITPLPGVLSSSLSAGGLMGR